MVALAWTLGIGFWLVSGYLVLSITRGELRTLEKLEDSHEMELIRSRRQFEPDNPEPEQRMTKVAPENF